MDKAHSTKYNTNLAAEFHVLSTLHRLGHEATLTLGNKKKEKLNVTTKDDRFRTTRINL